MALNVGLDVSFDCMPGEEYERRQRNTAFKYAVAFIYRHVGSRFGDWIYWTSV
jgi:hypothetical protein